MAVGIRTNRVVLQIDIHAAGQRIGHHQRRRSQIVRAHQRIDAALEVAIAAQHRRDDQLAFLHRLGDGLGQRPAVADAGGASVADQIELQLLQIRCQAGVVQIIGHYFGAGRETGLHPGFDFQAFFDSFLGQQTGSDHHGRIRSIGATGDGGDDHRTVLNGGLRSVGRDLSGLLRRVQRVQEILLDVRKIDAILRALGPRHGRNHGTEIEFESGRSIPDPWNRA